MNWYHCYFTDGEIIPIYSASLASAIYYAELWCPGRRVVKAVPLDEFGQEVR